MTDETVELDDRESVPGYIQASRVSYIAPLVAIFLNLTLGKKTSDPIVLTGLAVITLVAAAVGLACGIWAIFQAFRKGPLKILAPAITGLLFTGFILFIAFAALQVRWERERQERSKTYTLASGEVIPGGEGWYVDRSNLYAIQLPEDWDPISVSDFGDSIVAVSPRETSRDEAQERIAISFEAVPDRAVLADLFAADLRDVRRGSSYHEKLGSGVKTIQTLEWQWYAYRKVITSKAVDVTMYQTIHDNIRYAVVSVVPKALDDESRNAIAASIDTMRIANVSGRDRG